MRKYNPALKNVVDNHRANCRAAGHDTKNYSDEELFAIIQHWYGVQDEAGNDVSESAVIADVAAGNYRGGQAK